MADYIYMMESRLTPEQQLAVALISEVSRAHEMNIFLTVRPVREVNTGRRRLVADTSNGVCDLGAKGLRVVNNYSFLEGPSRLIRATRFLARFHWNLEERTQARYAAAIENNYIEYLHNERVIGQ